MKRGVMFRECVKPGLVICGVLWICVITAEAQIPSQKGRDSLQRAVTVTGHGAIEVVPDQIVIILGIETESEDLGIAESQNDARTKKVLSVVREMGVSQDDIQTSQLSISPRYRDVYEQQTFAGYTAEKKIVVFLKEAEKYRQLISGILEAKVNYVHGVELRHSAIKDYGKKARLMAVRDAREKARVLAEELGQQTGEPIFIEELPLREQPLAFPLGEGQNAQSVPQALGKIEVTAAVMVSFTLAPAEQGFGPKRNMPVVESLPTH